MRNLLKPRWILVINTLPVIVLLFICFGEFKIIKSLLEPGIINLWIIFGSILFILLILNLLYVLLLGYKKRELPIWYGFASLFIYLTFLYIYGNYADDLIPFSVPRWMVSENILIYVGTFLMPTLLHSLLILVLKFTPESRPAVAWKNFLIALGIPLFWYIVSTVITPFWRIVDSKFGMHMVFIFFISGTVLFLFFLIRSVYILAKKKGEKFVKYHLLWKIPVSIVLPIIGLALNNGILDSRATQYNNYVFGDFSAYWFYAIAVLNGIFICLPNLQNKTYRLFLFIARSLTFAYTLYFFLVFLPFLPLSIVAIIAFGAGFLMLTPLVLFVIHVIELSKDYNFLKENYSLKAIYAISIIAFMVLPLGLTTSYVHHKRTLNQALEYLYSPDYTKNYRIDKESLRKTMNEVANFRKSRNTDILAGNQTPYLTSWFSWIVLDNMTLSDAKYNRIENVFFDKTLTEENNSGLGNDSVTITNIKSSSRYDRSQQAWISNLDIELTNRNQNRWNAEYVTNFELPTGCYISDYYLFIGDRKEMGILAEKKSAMWVFQQIRDFRRDPGILYYLNGNRVAFRVFPFALNEVRKTGIEFIHKEPVNILIDNNIVELGNYSEQANVNITESSDKNVVYIPASEKEKLPQVKMAPYYHFLIDVSSKEKSGINTNIALIDSFLIKNKLSENEDKISFVGSDFTTCSLKDEWKSMYNGQYFEGGFFLERAIKSIIAAAWKNKGNSYPVMVVLSNNINSAIIDNSIADYKTFYPECDFFFELNQNGKLVKHSLTSNPLNEIDDSTKTDLNPMLFAYPDRTNCLAYLSNDHKSSIVLKNEQFDLDQKQIKAKDWQSALVMQGLYFSQILHPERSADQWLKLVKYSFISKVMNPFTSYLAVENEAQKAVLKRKQEQVLAGNKNLDLSENVNRMSEPGLYILILLSGLFIWLKSKKKLKVFEK